MENEIQKTLKHDLSAQGTQTSQLCLDQLIEKVIRYEGFIRLTQSYGKVLGHCIC